MRKALIIAALCFPAALAHSFGADEKAPVSNWDKFKGAVRDAGEAAWDGTKNVARDSGKAVSEAYSGAKEYVGERYDASKTYLEEEYEEHVAEEEGRVPDAAEPAPGEQQ